MSKEILIFGDSNTAGQSEYDEVRGASFHPDDEHWPHIVQESLPELTVHTRGLPGRFAGDLGERAELHGHTGFVEELGAIGDMQSLRYIVIALGINDLQGDFERSAEQLTRDLGRYAQLAAEYGSTAEMIVIGIPDYKESRYMRSDPARRDAVNSYLDRHFHYIPADDIVCGQDGVHYNRSDHEKIATRVIARIQALEAQKEEKIQ